MGKEKLNLLIITIALLSIVPLVNTCR